GPARREEAGGRRVGPAAGRLPCRCGHPGRVTREKGMRSMALFAVVQLLVVGLIRPGDGKPAVGFEVEVVTGIAYGGGKDAAPVRHTPDLSRPTDKKDYPVLVWVHGGGWKSGNKEQFEFLAKALAGEGVGVVTVNYRLHPQVKFPANVEDVARAFAWTHKNVGRYGGRADRVFVGGHSAGGDLADVLATDGAYPEAAGPVAADGPGLGSVRRPARGPP